MLRSLEKWKIFVLSSKTWSVNYAVSKITKCQFLHFKLENTKTILRKLRYRSQNFTRKFQAVLEMLKSLALQEVYTAVTISTTKSWEIFIFLLLFKVMDNSSSVKLIQKIFFGAMKSNKKNIWTDSNFATLWKT